MPYGLRGLDEREHDVLTRWLAAGAPGDSPLPPSDVRGAPGAGVGAVSQRRLAQGAADEPLPVRAPVPRPPGVRGRCREQRVPHRPFHHRTRCAGRGRGDAATLRRPRRGARVLPARAGARDPARQDAHALPAVAGAHGQVPRLVPRCRLPRRRAAVVRPGAGVEPVHQLRRDPARFALSLPARRGRVLHHELHQGPGLPRPGGGGRDRGSASGSSSSTPSRAPRSGAPSCWRARPTTCACRRPMAAMRACCSAAGASWPSARTACSPPRRRK